MSKPTGQRRDGYTLSDGVPWPTLGCGTPWVDGLDRVVHARAIAEGGRLHHVEWCAPDGAYLKERVKVRPATKTMGERRELHPGQWFGIVSWDNRETWNFPLTSRVPLVELAVE